jgi:hypothetical protein
MIYSKASRELFDAVRFESYRRWPCSEADIGAIVEAEAKRLRISMTKKKIDYSANSQFEWMEKNYESWIAQKPRQLNDLIEFFAKIEGRALGGQSGKIRGMISERKTDWRG